MNSEYKKLLKAAFEAREHLLERADLDYDNDNKWQKSDPDNYRVYNKLNKALIPFERDVL